MAGRRSRHQGPGLLDLPLFILQDLLETLAANPVDWACAAAACKVLYKVALMAPVLPQLEVGVEKGTAPSLHGLCKALVHRRRRQLPSQLCRTLVVRPSSLKDSGHLLRHLLSLLHGDSAPSALTLQWLSGWQHCDGSGAPARLLVQLHKGLAQLSPLTRLELQLRSGGGGGAPCHLHCGMLSGLRNLQELRVDIDSSSPYVEMHAASFPSLTRLALRHAAPEHDALPDPTSRALLYPALLPALRALELHAWHALELLGGTRAASWRVPSVHVTGPCWHAYYAGLAPEELSVSSCILLPEVDYTWLQRLRLGRLQLLESLRLGPPVMPRLEVLELEQGVGQAGEVQAFVARCPLTVQVSEPPGGTTTFDRYVSSRGLGALQVLTEGAAAGGAAAMGG